MYYRNMWKVPLLIVLILVGPCCEISAEPLRITRITEKITIDGQLDELCWSSIPILPVVMFAPNFGQEPSERTEIRIIYDDKYLYLGAKLEYTSEDQIQAPTKKRDAMNMNTDWFGLILDTFNDKENGLAFFTTPSGLRWDATVYNDAEGKMPINIDWNTFWDVASDISNGVWYAEFRIPFSSLRFQDNAGNVVMGLISWRWISKKNETVIFPAIPPNWGFWSTWKSSQAREIVFSDVKNTNRVYVAPYILGGKGKSFELNDQETGYEADSDLRSDIGLDLKYGLTSNLTMDVTVNTDFAQVEADDEQINLTRFSLFFPEKRMFFQERSSTFDFAFENNNRVFYSRRIGIYEDERVPIYGGLRLVGRLGGVDLGFLTMQTRAIDELESENFGVLRLRRRVFNPYSYVGGIVANRYTVNGEYNTALGLDGIFRIADNDYFTVQIAQTIDSDSADRPLALDQSRIRLNWQRRKTRGFGYNVNFASAGKHYNPAMGFELRENFSSLASRIEYGWIMNTSSPLYSHHMFLDGFTAFNNASREVQSSKWGPGWWFQTKSQYFGQFSFVHYYENIEEAFSFSGDEDIDDVLPGEYSFFGIESIFDTPASKSIYLRMLLEAGSFYGGWRTSLGLNPGWHPIDDIELGAGYQYNFIELKDERNINSRIVKLRLLATLSLKFSVSAFVQYNSIDHIIVSNGRLRYNPREGVDFYFVYDEGYHTHRHRERPYLPARKNRTILFKYTYTMRL